MNSKLEKILLLESRLSKIEKLINEEKQVGIIYHVCRMQDWLKYILPNDTLSASGVHSNFLHKNDDGTAQKNWVSFTRNKSFVVSTKPMQKATIVMQLVVDGTVLSRKYKVTPYNDLAFTNQGDITPDDETTREAEEAAEGPIKNISKYLLATNVDFKEMNESILRQVKKNLFNHGVTYCPFIKNTKDIVFADFMEKNGFTINDYKKAVPIEEVYPILQKFVNMQKAEELLFSYDIDDVKKAIKLKVDLNAKYTSGYAPEEYCSSEDDIEILELLLNNGVNPNLKVEGGVPLIVSAAEYGNALAVAALAEFGANVNQKNNEGKTSLHIAANGKDLDVTKSLIEAGADVNVKDNDGFTPLMLAIKNKDAKMTSYLLSSGANINVTSKNGDTPVSLAGTNRNIKSALKKAGANV